MVDRSHNLSPPPLSVFRGWFGLHYPVLARRAGTHYAKQRERSLRLRHPSSFRLLALHVRDSLPEISTNPLGLRPQEGSSLGKPHSRMYHFLEPGRHGFRYLGDPHADPDLGDPQDLQAKHCILWYRHSQKNPDRQIPERQPPTSPP